MNSDTGFPMFLAVWNRAQGLATPKVHMKMARWLMARWKAVDTRLLLMAFRSCGKSTIVGLYAAWLLWRNPALRILVLAADGALARKMVRNTKRIIERHPLTKTMKPERADQWAADRFTVRRHAEWRDPSMIAFGIGANMTGSRADVIICDDVEVPNTCDTPEKRAHLRERLAELSFVLTPTGTQLFVGTPHSHDTLYESDFLEGYRHLRIPLVDGNGLCAWPERFDAEDIADLRRVSGPRRFAAQMLLQAVPLSDSRLDVDQLQWYAQDVVYSEAQGRPYLTLDGKRLVGCSAWWDPAFGQGGDGSVVAVVYADQAGASYLHRLEYLKTRQDAGEDEATQQCRAVAGLCRALHVQAIAVEINGIGRFLPSILRREMKDAVAVIEMTSRRSKDLRILEAFDAVLAARALYVHRSVGKTPFVNEMRAWTPNGKCTDDGLDAVSGALSQQPVRVGSGKRYARPQGPFGIADVYTAKNNFNVIE